MLSSAKITKSWHQLVMGSRGIGALEQPSSNLLPLYDAQDSSRVGGCVYCACTGAQTQLCLAHCPFPKVWALPAWMLAQEVDAVHHSEEEVGLVSSSSAVHIRIWGNKINTLTPCLYCESRGGESCVPPTSAANYQTCASVTGGQQGHGFPVPTEPYLLEGLSSGNVEL